MRSRRLLTIGSQRCLSRKEAIQVLGLEKNFEKSELKSVYLEKAKLYHPDKSDSNPEYFEKIKEAYEFLENEKPQGIFFKNHKLFHDRICECVFPMVRPDSAVKRRRPSRRRTPLNIQIQDIFENCREFWNFEKSGCS